MFGALGALGAENGAYGGGGHTEPRFDFERGQAERGQVDDLVVAGGGPLHTGRFVCGPGVGNGCGVVKGVVVPGPHRCPVSAAGLVAGAAVCLGIDAVPTRIGAPQCVVQGLDRPDRAHAHPFAGHQGADAAPGHAQASGETGLRPSSGDQGLQAPPGAGGVDDGGRSEEVLGGFDGQNGLGEAGAYLPLRWGAAFGTAVQDGLQPLAVHPGGLGDAAQAQAARLQPAQVCADRCGIDVRLPLAPAYGLFAGVAPLGDGEAAHVAAAAVELVPGIAVVSRAHTVGPCITRRRLWT